MAKLTKGYETEIRGGASSAEKGGLLERIASDTVLTEAYTWLCDARKDAHHNSDVWHLRFYWSRIKVEIQNDLLQGCYRFSPCKTFFVDGESLGRWCAQDALVLKAMAIVLSEALANQLPQHCVHLAGRGGAKGCVSLVQKRVQDYAFVCRSDVNSYYATVDHNVLRRELRELIEDRRVCALIDLMLGRVDDINGELRSVEKGISKGNPLSPLLGAVYLRSFDLAIGEYCETRGLIYRRYMDDWIILCKTRGQLRRAVKLMHSGLERAKMTIHPLKTYIGRIKEEGFDFLGYRIMKGKLKAAWKTWVNHRTRLRQLYEQNTSIEDIGAYVKRWLQWLRSGVDFDVREAVRHFPILDVRSELLYWDALE